VETWVYATEEKFLNKRGEMKKRLIERDTERIHLCMSWSGQGGRDAVIPNTNWKPGELERIKESSRKKHELSLTALESLIRSPYNEKGELKPEFEIRDDDGMIHRRINYIAAEPRKPEPIKSQTKYW
jgi:hypothetical protein